MAQAAFDYAVDYMKEREVFGKVRYMSSKNTRRKLRLDRYLNRWASSQER